VSDGHCIFHRSRKRERRALYLDREQIENQMQCPSLTLSAPMIHQPAIREIFSLAHAMMTSSHDQAKLYDMQSHSPETPR